MILGHTKRRDAPENIATTEGIRGRTGIGRPREVVFDGLLRERR